MQCRDLNIPQKSYSIPILLLWFYTDNSQRWWLSLTERMRRARNEIIDRLRAQWAERAWKQGMILNMRWNTAGVLGRGWKWMKGDKMNESGKMDENEWKWMKMDENGLKMDESGWKWMKMGESGWNRLLLWHCGKWWRKELLAKLWTWKL